MLELSVNLKDLTPSSCVFIQQTGILQPAEVCWALQQVHRVEILQPTNVFSPGTPSPVPSSVHLQSGPPGTWVPMLGHQDTGQPLPLGEQIAEIAPSSRLTQPCRGQAWELSTGCISAPSCPLSTTYTTLFSSPACAAGVA